MTYSTFIDELTGIDNCTVDFYKRLDGMVANIKIKNNTVYFFDIPDPNDDVDHTIISYTLTKMNRTDLITQFQLI